MFRKLERSMRRRKPLGFRQKKKKKRSETPRQSVGLRRALLRRGVPEERKSQDEVARDLLVPEEKNANLPRIMRSEAMFFDSESENNESSISSQ